MSMDRGSKKFSLYLLREGVRLDRASLRISKGTTVDDLPTAEGLAFPHAAFIVRNKPSRPRWSAHLADHFDVADLENQTSSVVLLFEAAQRVWALTYGNGFHLVQPGSIEPAFGLKVVANSIDPSEIKSADARTPDVVSRTTRSQVSRGSQIGALGVAVDRELIKHLAGKPLSDEGTEAWARRLAGSDSLQVNADWDLADLETHASFLLEQFQSDNYRDAFGFIDNFRPLRSGDPLVEHLDGLLAEALDGRQTQKLSLAAPEVLDEDRFDHFKVIFAGKSEEMSELALVDLYELLDQWDVGGADALHKVSVIAVDGDGAAASTKRELRRYLAAELTDDDATYMLVTGQWFLVEAGYVDRINARVRSLAASSREHPLPEWPVGLGEGEYNALAAGSPDWQLLDKSMIHHGGPNQKVEFGDLLSTDSRSLVHVKKMSSSATLSHLWAQGAVAGQLYKTDPDFQQKVRELIPTVPADMSDLTVVYAVANSRNGAIEDELFFFSKVHLVQQLETLMLIGCPVELVKIDMVDTAS